MYLNIFFSIFGNVVFFFSPHNKTITRLISPSTPQQQHEMKVSEPLHSLQKHQMRKRLKKKERKKGKMKVKTDWALVSVPGERASRWMVLGVRDLGVAWLRPGQGSWSGEGSAGVAKEVSDRRGSELGWARSSEPVPGWDMAVLKPVASWIIR